MNRTCGLLICFNGLLDDIVLLGLIIMITIPLKPNIYDNSVGLIKKKKNKQKMKLDQCLLMGHQLKSIKKPLIGFFIWK